MNVFSNVYSRSQMKNCGEAIKALFTTFSICAALAMVGCAPKVPPVASVSAKPQATTKYDAIVLEQKDLKTRLDAQMNAMLALQEHMAALEDRMSMLEQNMTSKAPVVTTKTKRKVSRHTHLVNAGRHRVHHVKSHLASTHKSIKPIAINSGRQTKSQISKAENAAIQNDYDAAMRLLKHGDYETAATALAKFVKKYPGDALTPKAQYWLGEALFAKEDFDRVISTLRSFESMPVSTPKRAPALFRLGASYQRIGSNADAVMAFNILRRDYPNSAEAANAIQQLNQLKKLGVGSATPPMPTAKTKSVKKSPAMSTKAEAHPSQKWAVNIVSVDSLPEAKRVLQHLHLMGFHAKIMKAKVKGKVWYRLRTVGYRSRNHAEDARQAFVKKGYTGAWASPE